MILASRHGWSCFRVQAPSPTGRGNCANLVFLSHNSDEGWTLQFSAQHEYQYNGNQLRITYNLAWLCAGEDRYASDEFAPTFLMEIFEKEIAGFKAYMKLVNQWPDDEFKDWSDEKWVPSDSSKDQQT